MQYGNEVTRDKPSGRWWKIALLVAGSIVAVLVVVGLMLGGEPDPNELARAYIEGNIDKLGEDVAGFVVGDNWLLRELGGEYVEDRVNDVIHWSYSPARLVSDGEYRVIATASVVFNVDYDVLGRTFFIEASLPFELMVRPGDDTVSARPDYAAGRIDHNIPKVPQLPSAEEAIEKAEEAAEKVDAAKEELNEKAGDVLKKLGN